MSGYEAEIIVFDLDGTAVPNAPDGEPSLRLVEAIKAAQPNIRLCAATGRPIANAQPILKSLGLVDPCVISAGTQIIDPRTESTLWEASIADDDRDHIVDVCRSYPYELLIKNELRGEGARAARRIIRESVNVMYLMDCTPLDAVAILEELGAIPDITAAGVESWNGVDIHITHREATKEHAIAELLGMLGIKKSAAIGVGDANNDLHLFKAVGHKIAMGNGTDLLKAQADEICASVDEDGLAQVIERFA